MKHLFIILALTFSSLALASNDCQHSETAFRCVKYVANYDADTVKIDVPMVHPLIGKGISVRVLGIDTPEIKGKLPCEKDAARNAKRLVENLLKNANRIDILDIDRDKYFRILGRVVVDGKDLSQILLKNGLAYPYFGETKEKRNWCNVARK